MNPLTDRQHSWSQYWASGALHSCVGSFDDNYAGAIAEFWQAVASGLPSAARVLDLATGNGALPRLLLEHTAATHRLQIDAVDLAELAPAWTQALSLDDRARLRFHPGVRAEALPFADASFDLVVSQYGLEYTDVPASAAEIRRVLAPHGEIALVLHHAESLPVRIGRAELGAIDWLLGAGGLLAAAAAMLPYMARLATPAGMAAVQQDPAAAHARGAYNASLRAIEIRAATNPAAAGVLQDTGQRVGALIAATPSLGADAAAQHLHALAAQLHEARLRQRELVECALDAPALDDLTRLLTAGRAASVSIGQVHVRDELFGWTVRIRSRVE